MEDNKAQNLKESKDISKIKLPDGEIYNIKDETVREGLRWLLGDDYDTKTLENSL